MDIQITKSAAVGMINDLIKASCLPIKYGSMPSVEDTRKSTRAYASWSLDLGSDFGKTVGLRIDFKPVCDKYKVIGWTINIQLNTSSQCRKLSEIKEYVALTSKVIAVADRIDGLNIYEVIPDYEAIENDRRELEAEKAANEASEKARVARKAEAIKARTQKAAATRKARKEAKIQYEKQLADVRAAHAATQA